MLTEEHTGLAPGQLLPWKETELAKKVTRFKEGFEKVKGDDDEPSPDEPIYREQKLYLLKEEK